MAISAIIHERCLQGRLNARHLCEVDVASKLATVHGFKVELLNLVSVCHDNPSFLGMGGVDEHFFSHCVFLQDTAKGGPALPRRVIERIDPTREGGGAARAASGLDGAIRQLRKPKRGRAISVGGACCSIAALCIAVCLRHDPGKAGRVRFMGPSTRVSRAGAVGVGRFRPAIKLCRGWRSRASQSCHSESLVSDTAQMRWPTLPS